ncbi:hypothetical protein NS220_10015 [Microbacterium testaceum]|uniref:ABC-2 type transport system permease protein n=1 Tax=Microbacterium testaceum TaxID=2033 RepID=A0A147EWX2_MICTE|nr:hypothetical protein [Microbacterium testaceum]KTR94162.1 hypothetical protein NS220_10015 [Microbacterium testaceum]
MTPVALTIATVSWRMWARDLCRVLRVSTRFAFIVMGASVGAAFVFGGLLAAVTARQVGGELPPELGLTIVRSSLAGVWLSSGLLATVFALTVPSRTMLQSLLDLLPVSRRAATFGQLVPMSTVTIVFCVALALPTIAIFSRLFSGPALAAAVGSVIVSIVAAQVFAVTLLLIVSWAARRLFRLATRYADTLAALLVMSSFGWSASADLLTRELAQPSQVDLLPHRILAAAVAGSATVPSAIVAASWVVAAVGLIAVASAVRPTASEPRLPSFLRGWKPRGGVFRALVWLEIVTTVRTVQFVMTTLAAFALVGLAAWLHGGAGTAELARAIASAAPIAPAAVNMYAVGRALPIRWIGDHISPRTAWPAATAAASIATSISVALVVAALLLGLGSLPAESVAGVAARVLLAAALALLAGAVIPVSQEQPISTTAAAFLCGVLLLGGSVGVNAAVDAAGVGAFAVILIAVAGSLGVYARVCERHVAGDRVRA